MFISNAYEQRMKQQDELIDHTKQFKKVQKVGSIKNGRINYDKDEQFFSSLDVDYNVRQVVKEVKQFIDPDILELRKKPWNATVSCPKNNELEETFERRLIKIKLGLIDRPKPKYIPRKIELGCDLRDDYTNWNVSTQQDLRERTQMLEYQTMSALESTKMNRDKMLSQYTGNIQRQVNLIDNLRTEKIVEKDYRDNIRKEYRFINPTSSQQKTDGAVFRIAYEQKLAKKQKNQDEQLGEMSFKPNCSKTLKHHVTIKAVHTGTYQKLYARRNNYQDDDTESHNVKYVKAWSCCMNEDRQSEGCNKINSDKNSWNYASIKQY